MATTLGSQVWNSRRLSTTSWLAIPNGNQGSAETPGRLSDRTVQVNGTFGAGGSVTLQGSNDGTNWITMRAPDSTPLTFTTADIKQVLENTQYMRPSVTAGDGTTAINVYLVCEASA